MPHSLRTISVFAFVFAFAGPYDLLPTTYDLFAATTTSAPTTQPTSRPAAFDPLPQAAGIADGLKFTELERDILAAVRDRNSQLDETGLYVMFRRAAAMPTLTRRQFQELDNISMQTLMAAPEKFRGQAMLVKAKIFTARKWTVPEHLSNSRWWPRSRPVWMLTGVDMARKPNQPLSIISVADPSELLGKPDKTIDGQARYTDGRDIEFAAIFYKVYADMTIGNVKTGEEPGMMEFPAFIAWQGQCSALKLQDDGGGSTTSLLMLAGALLVAAFFYLHHRNSRMKKDFAARRHGRVQAVIHDDEPSTEPKDDTVDADLQAAVERMRKDSDDDTHRPS